MRHNATKSTRKCYGYVRVSTDKQSLSLDAQSTKIAAMAAVQDVLVTEIIADSESGKSTDRPGLQRLLGMVAAGQVQTVLIAKLDRLTRSVRDLSEMLELFRKHDVALVSVAESLDTGSAAGRMVIGILGVVAQWEREAIAERTSAVLRHKRSALKAFNHTPFGFERVGDDLVPVQAEQTAIARAKTLRDQGWTLARIAQALTDDGTPTKAGGRWYPSTVANILRVA